jgi:hypothetical protein
MNTPKTTKRYKGEKPPGPDAIVGRYDAGIQNAKFAVALGEIIATWVHVEDLMIRVLQDLLGSKNAPARQIFHSILSNKSRKMVMLACLQKAKVNARKSALYDAMITQFSDINTMRNKFLHSLWYTHESGRVFLSESALDDYHWMDAREVTFEELKSMKALMTELHVKIEHRRSPKLVESMFASHAKLPQQPIRRNKKKYRRQTKDVKL